MLLETFKALQNVTGPKLLHVITTKGKGLKMAEENQVIYHAPGKFNKDTGEQILAEELDLPPKYQEVFGITLVELAQQNPNIVGITPAMPTGSSLKFMMESMPERAIDVGIAEQHAVTMAAGMAVEGLVPFCNIYSTFLQRAYDQVIHDVALQKLPVIFCLDRAGLVGHDGATHHGAYDLAYLQCIPNLLIFAPMNEGELRDIMYTAQFGLDRPIAIRYPRGRATTSDWRKPFALMPLGQGQTLKTGTKIAVLSVGHIGNAVAKLLQDKAYESVGHYNMRFVKPLDVTLLQNIFGHYTHVITVEDGCLIGGFGTTVGTYANSVRTHCTLKHFGIPDTFIEHGSVPELQYLAGFDAAAIEAYIKTLLVL